MPDIKTISDGGSDPNTPTIEEMRESQRKGSTGNGFSDSYAEKMGWQNQGTGLGEGKDKEPFPEAAEYKEY